MKIPEILRAYREEHSLSLSRFAKLYGFDKGEISRWENEKRVLSIGSVLELHEKLGLSLTELLQAWVDDAIEHDRRKRAS